MTVSVIIPVYNTAKYLERCVKSIMRQSFTDLEIILINDGSTDNSGDICNRLRQQDSRIKVLHQENMGLSRARNAGIDAAVGEYYLFVDSDDCVSPFYVEKLLNMCLENNTKISLCGYCLNDETTEPEGVPAPLMLYPTEIIDKRNYFLRIYTDKEILYVIACNKIYHKSLFKDLRYAVGKRNEDEGIIHHIIDRCETIAVCYEPLYFYTIRNNSIMTSNDFKPSMFDIFEFWQDRIDYFYSIRQRDLAFMTMKNYLVTCLKLYNKITTDTPDGKMYKNHLKRMYSTMLKRAQHCPASSKKFILKMKYYSIKPSAFKNIDRREFLFSNN